MQRVYSGLTSSLITASLIVLCSCSSAVNPWYDKNSKRSQTFKQRYTPKENRFIVAGGYAKQDDFNPFYEVNNANVNNQSPYPTSALTSNPPPVPYQTVETKITPITQRKDLPPLAPNDFQKRQQQSINQPMMPQNVTEAQSHRVDEQQIQNTYEGNGFYTGPKQLYQNSSYHPGAQAIDDNKSTRKKGEDSSFKQLVGKLFTSKQATTQPAVAQQPAAPQHHAAPHEQYAPSQNPVLTPVNNVKTEANNYIAPDQVIELTPTFTEQGSADGYNYYDRAENIKNSKPVVADVSEFDLYYVTSIKPDNKSFFTKMQEGLVNSFKAIFTVKKAYAHSEPSHIKVENSPQKNRSANLDAEEIVVPDIDNHQLEAQKNKDYPQLKDTPAVPENIRQKQAEQHTKEKE